MNSNKQYWLRFGAVFVAVIVILYMAKFWFFQDKRIRKQSHPRTSVTANSANHVTTNAVLIDWTEANKHYGEYVTVAGTIVTTHNSGKVCFLNFNSNYKKYFSAVIFASDYSKFPAPPEKLYADKKIRVRGKIEKYNGKPEIIVKSPEQIEIVK
jgi:lysyl-tRNA synthetase class II